MPAIIIVGIVGGICTATEAGVLATVYGIFYGIVTKKLTWKLFGKSLTESCISAAGPFIIITYSNVFSYMLTRMNVANMVSDFVINNISDMHVFLLFIVLICTIAGCFVDGIATMLMLLPVLMPVVAEMNIDFQHFALVYVLALLTCQITPPVGNTLYVAAGILRTPVRKVVKPIIPFCIVMVVVIITLVYVPALATWLPRVIFG